MKVRQGFALDEVTGQGGEHVVALVGLAAETLRSEKLWERWYPGRDGKSMGSLARFSEFVRIFRCSCFEDMNIQDIQGRMKPSPCRESQSAVLRGP